MPTRAAAAGDVQDSSRLHGVFSRLAAWLIIATFMVGATANVWLQQRIRINGDSLWDDLPLYVGFGAFAAVGSLLVAKRPTNIVGWIMAAVGLMIGIFPLGDTYAGYVVADRAQPNALAVFGAWTQSWYWYLLLALAIFYLPLLFPDGRLPSRRWLPLALLVGIGTLFVAVLGALTDTLTGQDVPYRIDNPVGIEGLAPVEDLPVFGLFGVCLGIGLLGAVAAVVMRFRRARAVERQQMKWFLYASALIVVVPILELPVLDSLPELVNSVLFDLLIIALPTAIGIAVLRYRLYDIDLLINRTLVYGVLTVSLVLTYFCGVVALQFVFRAATGGESQLAVVASTLAIAALFNPLRRRTQSFIDRLFYRKKYDASLILAAYGNRLRGDVDLKTLHDDLLGVVGGTVQPAHASLWLRPPEGAPASEGQEA